MTYAQFEAASQLPSRVCYAGSFPFHFASNCLQFIAPHKCYQCANTHPHPHTEGDIHMTTHSSRCSPECRMHFCRTLAHKQQELQQIENIIRRHTHIALNIKIYIYMYIQSVSQSVRSSARQADRQTDSLSRESIVATSIIVAYWQLLLPSADDKAENADGAAQRLILESKFTTNSPAIKTNSVFCSAKLSLRTA